MNKSIWHIRVVIWFAVGLTAIPLTAYYGMIFYESIDERYEEGVGEVAAPWDNRWLGGTPQEWGCIDESKE